MDGPQEAHQAYCVQTAECTGAARFGTLSLKKHGAIYTQSRDTGEMPRLKIGPADFAQNRRLSRLHFCFLASVPFANVAMAMPCQIFLSFMVCLLATGHLFFFLKKLPCF